MGTRATACALLVGALAGCGDPSVDSLVSSHGAGGAGGAGGAASSVVANTAGTGGSTPLAGTAGSATAGGGTGGAGPAQALTLSFSWSTYWIKGTTKTPLTCADLGAQAVGFAVSAKALDAETVLTPMGQFCENGTYQNYPITLPAGEYSLGVSLSSGSAESQTLKALLSGLGTFSVAPGTTHVDIPEIKLVRIMLPLSWTIEKSGSSSTCAAVGATQVDLVLNEVRDDYVNMISWSQPCSLNPSQPLAKPGTYQLSATLKNDSATLATWTAPDKLSFSTESAAIPPAITFKVP